MFRQEHNFYNLFMFFFLTHKRIKILLQFVELTYFRYFLICAIFFIFWL